ncbi:hypothetical protein Tco_1042942 [Tanacetum coccineum]|uniref:Uncharacterized protein n=1 Tax=Tanacetum coccineum TaxID=301880 RepID=A0ABQ5GKM5_9ASTR
MSSDSTSSKVTYTSISSHGDPLAWIMDLFGLQEPDSLEAAPTSPDYVLGPEEPEQAPTSPNYVPGPEYLGYLTLADDKIVIEDPPYADDASLIALSPGYEEEEASEEEHLALADSVIAPVVDPVPSSEETEPFKTDESAATPPPPADHTTPLRARISVRPQAPMPFPSKAKVKRLLALPTPPPSPLISLSQRLASYHGLRASSPSTRHPLHPSPPLPPLPVSLFIPPPFDHNEDILDAELPPRHRADYGFIGTLDVETRRQRAEEVGYGIRDVWVDPAEDVEEVAPTTLEGVNARVTELAEVQEEDTQDIYALGQLSTALGQIQALQARDSTHADDPEGADSCA